MGIKLPDDDALRKLAGVGRLRGLSEALETNRNLQGALFPKVTEIQGVVRPLDQEVLRRVSGAQFIGNQLREKLDLSQAGFDGDSETRILSWRKSSLHECQDHGSTPKSCSTEASTSSSSPGARSPT